MKIVDLFKIIAAKSGIQETEISDLLANTSLSSMELKDDLANKINALMTAEAAKNNPDLKAHFHALALSGADTEIAAMAEAFGLDKSILKEKNTYGNIREMSKTIKELLDGKGADSSDKDVTEYVKQIKELQDSLAQIKKSHQDEVNNLGLDHKDKIKTLAIQNLLSNQNIAADERFDKSTLVGMAANMLQQELQGKGASIVIDDNGKLLLKQDKSPELDYYDTATNTAVSIDSFVSKMLADRKLLKVSATPAPTLQKNQWQQPQQNGNSGENVDQFFNALNQSQQDVANNSK